MLETTSKYPRLYVNHNLRSGDVIPAETKHYHYLMNVLRFKPKDKVRLFNAQDGEWLAEITAPSKKAIEFKLLSVLRPAVLCDPLWLFFAPLKRVAMDFLIEKGTELGVTHFVPTITDYTQKTQFNVEKYTLTAIEAAEQCERFDIPILLEPQGLLSALSAYQGSGKILWGDESAARSSGEVNLPKAGNAILIGPEGGFSEAEREKLRQHPQVEACSLGPRILRAETAALAMLAIVNSR